MTSPLEQKKIKLAGPSMVTANRTWDGVVVYRTAAGEWAPVVGASAYGTEIDRFNRVTFEAVETTAIRVEVKLQPEWSGGILEWQLEEARR